MTGILGKEQICYHLADDYDLRIAISQGEPQMPISSKQILQVSDLARIKIEQDQINLLTEKIGEIISFVDKLKTIDTDGIVPLFNPLDAVQKLRSDAITEIDESEKYLEIAPVVENNLFIVPKVID